jgi:hypothetical protein
MGLRCGGAPSNIPTKFNIPTKAGIRCFPGGAEKRQPDTRGADDQESHDERRRGGDATGGSAGRGELIWGIVGRCGGNGDGSVTR